MTKDNRDFSKYIGGLLGALAGAVFTIIRIMVVYGNMPPEEAEKLLEKGNKLREFQ